MDKFFKRAVILTLGVLLGVIVMITISEPSDPNKLRYNYELSY